MVSTQWDGIQRQVDLKPVTRQKPCPICGKTSWCRTGDSGRIAECHRSTTATGSYRLAKLTPSGFGWFVLDDGLGVRVYLPRTVATKPLQAKPKPAAGISWADQAAAWGRDAGGQLQVLADHLGVDVDALRQLGVGWDVAKPHGMRGTCWTFPVRDGDGDVIGIALRFPEPRRNKVGDLVDKAMITGSRSGLFYGPTSWSQGSGPILLVEGASDTAAALTMGLSVVGRPSNRGGVDHLAQLLRDAPADRPILVVGEHDQKADGNWPGRDGAVSTATQLAKQLHRAILWAMPPDGAKDVREFLRVCSLMGAAPRSVGQGLTKALLHDAESISGPPAPARESAVRPAGEARDLAAWRRDAAAAHQDAVMTPGLHLDRSPTGSGKTHATTASIRRAASSLVVLPTHANVRERVLEMQEAGIPAVPFPELTETNCQNYGEAQLAQSAGMTVGKTACIGCQFKKGCEYRREAAKASRARHRVATHARLIRSPSVATIRRSDGTKVPVAVGVIDENPVAVLRPTVVSSPPAIQDVGSLAWRIRSKALENGDRSGAATFADSIVNVCDAVATAIGRATAPGRYPVAMPAGLEVPKYWETVLWRAMMHHAAEAAPKSEAMQLVTRAITGQLDQLEVVTEKTPAGHLTHLIVGTWSTPLSSSTSWQLLDATARPEDVAAAAQQPVHDITPAGHLPNQHPVIQIPLSITASTSSAKVAGILRGLMKRYPQFTRWGVIGFRRHIDAIMGDGGTLLDAGSRGLVAKHCHFWQGPDRASNDWHQVCDVVVVLGTPRPNPMAIRSRLLLLGLDDAATIPDPVWGEIHWQATTTDGGVVTVPGCGYHHPEWRSAHRSICQSQLLQGMGRARSIMPEGVPCLVVSDEPTGAAVDVRPLETLPPAVQAILDAIGRAGGYQLPAITGANSEKLISPAVPTGAILAEYRKATGKPVTYQAVAKLLGQARRLRLVTSPGRGLWQLERVAEQPLIAAGPAEPVTVADVLPPEPVTVTTTESVDVDVLAAQQELIAERAAIMEFDGHMDRDQADHLAIEFVMGDALMAGRRGPSHQHTAVGFRPPIPQPKPDTQPVAMMQGDLWSPAELRQLNPWVGG